MKMIRITMFLFLGVGVLMLLGSVALGVGTSRFVARASSAPGTVVELRETRSSDGDTLYRPVVRFAAHTGGEFRFESRTASAPPAFSVGESVTVLYAPGNPQDARIDSVGSLWLGGLILGGMGVVFTGIGAGYFVYRLASEKKKSYLMAYGTAVETDFQSVERNESLQVNGRHPWRIVSQWQNPASGKLRLFNSENLWFDPAAYVKPGKITVLVDPKDERRYHMDVSFLPKLEEA